ncbi:MAG: phosphatidate cytidylyltransferase [Bacillota bacterium]|nr:MAG: phosphatidate cytidylyltransferase [Bacillota bacterium]
MLKRTLSGAVFVAVIVGFFFLREYVDIRLFNILVYFFSLVGTFEVWRALKNSEAFGGALGGRAGAAAGAIIAACALAFVPISTFFGLKWGTVVLVLGGAGAVLARAFSKENFGFNAGVCLLPVIYPNALLCGMIAANAYGENALLALLLIFVTSPLADTFAYLVGSLIGGRKLCPSVSPNKTVSGAIGGLVGGAAGALALYFIFTPELPLGWLIFLAIGLFAALFTELGDLFESWLKRRAGVKDMGKIMPGHGGVMDRIDGISFCAVFVALVFLAL